MNNTHLVALLVTVAVGLLPNAVAGSYGAGRTQQAKPNCPNTKVICSDSVLQNDTVKFTADVRGGDKNVSPTYNWTVSAGTIQSGQGTSTIDVDTNGLPAYSTITATVQLGGFDRECGYGSTVNSGSTSVLKKPVARKFDEYGRVSPKEESARLDNFFMELSADPTAQGVIIGYNAAASKTRDAQKAAERAKKYLVDERGVYFGRIKIEDGGSRKQTTFELWIVPSGAEPPKPSPTVKQGAKAVTPSVKSKATPTRRPTM